MRIRSVCASYLQNHKKYTPSPKIVKNRYIYTYMYKSKYTIRRIRIL